ncbi:MAG: site-specific integrase [Maribacter sp.]|nr:site-specific integrase [Maribacter sp.]MDP5229861.1 site-specific integrase [Cellulophaga sp.]
MRTNSTFSTLFWVYSKRATNNQANIYVRITVNSKKVNISLKKKTDIDLWDSARQRVKGHSKEARVTNLYLDEVQSLLFSHYKELKLEHKTLSAQILKSRFLGEEKTEYSLVDLITFFNDKMSNKLSPKTLTHYRTSQNYVLSFLQKEYTENDRFLRDLDYKFVIGLEDYLRGYRPKHYQGKIGNNAVMKHIQRLRRMINLALDMDWIDKDPFVKFKAKLEKRERDFLTKKELNKIESLPLKIARLDIVRDLFIFSCYTGIAYIDIMTLTSKNIIEGIDSENWIMSNRAKTGTPFKIPILSKAQNIIEKYSSTTNENIRLLPKLSNQKLNSYLKEIADLCKIEKNLTFHMARHTFATTVTLSNGVPLETVSKLLGHTKLATTQIYARVIEQKVSDDMSLLRSKIEVQKATLTIVK